MKRALFLLAAALPCVAGEVEVLDCDAVAGFETRLPAGGEPEAARLSAADGQIALEYERAKLCPLARYDVLTELVELRLLLRSDAAGTFALCLEDQDGASFHSGFALPANEWKTVALRPKDFALNHDSKTLKKALDPRRLGIGWLLIDTAAITGGSGVNVLRVDRIEIERTAIESSSGMLTIGPKDDVEWGASRRHDGPIVVQAGGRLRVTAPRFVHAGDLRCEGGTVEWSGGIVEIPQRFSHERTLAFSAGSSFAVRDARVLTRVPASIRLLGAATLEMGGVTVVGGFTTDVPEGSRVTILRTVGSGEYVVAPGSRMRVADCRGLLLWIALGTNLTGAFSYPDGDVPGEWKAGAGHDLVVERTADLKWGLLCLPGARGSLSAGLLSGAGLACSGTRTVRFPALQNNADLAGWILDPGDRRVTFAKARVGAWNVYAVETAKVELADSTFGEAMTFGSASIDVRSSFCDGTGGYVGAHEKSEIRLTKCRVTCLVVAKDDAKVTLVDCDVTGDVRAVDRAAVRLVRTKVSGRVEADAGATLKRED